HRVARRRVFLVCAGVWSLTALAIAVMSASAGVAAAGVSLAVSACLIGLIMAGRALAWQRHPIPSPKHLHQMSLPHTPGLGWLWFAVVSTAWVVLCVSAGGAALPLPYAVMALATVPLLVGSVVLVPGLLMGSRQQQLRQLLTRNPRARQQLDAWAADWTNADGQRPFGQV